MSEIEVPLCCVEEAPITIKPKKAKRDIIRFAGEKPTAINLEHVTSMYIEEKRISFEFYTKVQFVDFVDEATAAGVFEMLLTTWSAEAVE